MIYAIDFDGTLCEDKYPEIGEPNQPLIDFLKSEQQNGAELILWTMRGGKLLYNAIYWCHDLGLEFDAINDNILHLQEKFGNNPRKVYADRYIDNHNYNPILPGETS